MAEQTNGSGDPVAATVLEADEQAREGLRAPAETGVGSTPDGPPQGGIYVPSSMDPGDTPEAGDVDPGSNRSADETGQGGDVDELKKRKAFGWN
jgi:hypothetical protein